MRFANCRRPSIILVLICCLLPLACQETGEEVLEETVPEAEASWATLFDGETLDGWSNPYDWGEAWVEDGEIHLRGDRKFFLVTDTTYADFVLEADVRVPDTASNSGIMFRAQVNTNRVWGYQAEVDPSARAWAGGLYDEGRRGWLHPAQDDEAAGRAFREAHGEAFEPAQWNTYRIQAVGDSLQIWVNGQQTIAYRDSLDQDGHIGLQHHGEGSKVYRFRNVRIRKL